MCVFSTNFVGHGYEEIEGRVVNGVTADNFIPLHSSIDKSFN